MFRPCDKFLAPSLIKVYLDWVQLFGSQASESFNGRYKAAFRQLIAFHRLALSPGQVRHLNFTVTPRQLQVWRVNASTTSVWCGALSGDSKQPDECGSLVPAAGVARLSVGGQQPLQNVTVGSNSIISIINVVDLSTI